MHKQCGNALLLHEWDAQNYAHTTVCCVGDDWILARFVLLRLTNEATGDALAVIGIPASPATAVKVFLCCGHGILD